MSLGLSHGTVEFAISVSKIVFSGPSTRSDSVVLVFSGDAVPGPVIATMLVNVVDAGSLGEGKTESGQESPLSCHSPHRVVALHRPATRVDLPTPYLETEKTVDQLLVCTQGKHVE